MARNKGPACRVCRLEGMKLFLKGQKCTTEKCIFNKRSYSPGQHGQRRSKVSNYGLQLREKQKAKRIYGLMEKQFRNYFEKATRRKGVTGQILLQMLERRLDNVIFRGRFAVSRKDARQVVVHGHVLINGRKVNIPSYLVKEKDEIEIIQRDDIVKRIKEVYEETKDRGIPSWLTVDANNLKMQISRLPQREDIQIPIQEQLIIELYSK